VSVAHVASAWLPSQTVPAAVQADGTQVQLAVLPLTVQVWCVPHGVVGTHAVQPLACVWQASTPLAPHRVAPAVHALVQQEADPAAPMHAPPVQGVVADSKMQFWVSCEHVARVEALAHVGPAVAPQTEFWLHPQRAVPAAPVQAWFAAQATGVPYA
jgi:hypothetical protein